MRITALLPLIAAGCVSAEDSLGELELRATNATNEGCRPALCGLNAHDLTDGYFHELNLDGLANDDGFSLVDVRKNGLVYNLVVTNGKITATRLAVNGVLSGQELVGLEIRMRRTGSSTIRILKIEGVSNANYWAKPFPSSPPPSLETYKFSYAVGTGGMKDWVCQNGDAFYDAGTSYVPMAPHHAVVFEGDRIDVESLTFQHVQQVPGQANRWFTIGCAETALAKVHLNGQTKAAQGVGFSSTTFQRQAFLKLIMADYCGNGVSFTENAHPLRWRDGAGTMTFPVTEAVELEALWDQNGATCLNTPRLTANPTDESLAAWPNGPEGLIRLLCGGQLPPPCPTWVSSSQLRSYNPQL